MRSIHVLFQGGKRIKEVLTTQRRLISTKQARSILGISGSDREPLTIRRLRQAYFERAKETHPDVTASNTVASSSAIDFRSITEAYETLLSAAKGDRMEIVISQDEEDAYREACRSVLGLPAEIVEESKQNPMFRKWLGGRTDGAQYWRAFFANNGGLAQKLKSRPLLDGSSAAVEGVTSRRKRKR